MGNSYRPEIDGLRAIAVVGVLAFHAGLGGAGYVGVDVFFVISGYLITRLLVEEFDAQGRVDAWAFYGRRARRILPALVVVVVSTVLVGGVLLSSTEQSLLDKSAAASLVFVANVFFPAVTGGYFDVRSVELPLLHLWSLSVEEQFYLAWPVLLLLILRTRRPKAGAVVACLGLLSFAFVTVALDAAPEIAFFQMPARFWELAAGGLAAMSSRRLASRWGLAGLVLVLLACIWPIQPFPGIGALPAVAGAFLIVASEDGAGTRVLRSRPMVAIGLVSYSLYLWHWPLLSMYRATSIGDSSVPIRLGLCLVAGVLAAATYRYVEQPIRKMPVRGFRAVLAGVSISTALALVALVMAANALNSGAPENALAKRATTDVLTLRCHSNFSDGPEPKCPVPPHARIAIWGDSMAWSWTPALQDAGPALLALTRDACAPLLGFLPDPPHPPERTCLEANRRDALLVAGVDKLVLVARWTNQAARFDGLDRTLRQVAPTVGEIVIVGPTPELRDDVPSCIIRHREADCAIPRSAFLASSRPMLETLRRLASAYPNVRVFDPTDGLCSRDTCPAVMGGVPLYIDDHHLTMSAVRRIGIPGVTDTRRAH